MHILGTVTPVAGANPKGVPGVTPPPFLSQADRLNAGL